VTVAVLLAVAGLPLGLSLAQVTPAIEIINPHTGVALEVGDKGQPYHLNSWVTTVPPSPLVEYELDVTQSVVGELPETETLNLGQATQSGSAFGLVWDVEDSISEEPDPPNTDITFTLRAILYTGFTGPGTGVEVSRDEQDITINHQGDDAAETVEMTYPTNGGPLGVYIRPDGSGGNFTIDATVSAGTRFVRPYYTISEFGEDPVWKQCGGYQGVTTEDDGTKTARARCSTVAGDYALDVTGVALVTNDTPSPAGSGQAQAQFNDASDAHAVAPYFQLASTVVVDPVSTSNAAFGGNGTPCVQYVATVEDDQGRPIGNMNLDVAAQGPSDQLKFDAYSGSGAVSSASQPPDKAHPGSPENAVACDGTGGSRNGAFGQQGDHNVPGGSDVKHIESVGGTNASGRFEFALVADRAGETQVTVYADEDDDDKRCSQEKSADAAIGWGQGAPGTTGVSTETDSCPVGTPSPTPTPTDSGSPTESPSNGTTSPPPEKEKHSREVTIKFAHGSLIVSGKLSVDDGTNKCRQNVSVQVQRRQDKKWKTKKTVTTNNSGNYSTTLKDKEGKYRARAVKVKKGNDVCLLATAVKKHNH
jgi:hypothetical protein